MLPCVDRKYEVEYNGNFYTDFYEYPDPDVFHAQCLDEYGTKDDTHPDCQGQAAAAAEDLRMQSKHYQACKGRIGRNAHHKMSEK